MVSCVLCGLSHNARKIGITFHRFPKKPRELRAAWMKFVNKTEETVPKNVFLCSQHFNQSDFITSPFRKILEQNVVPSVYIQRTKYDKVSRVAPETVSAQGSSGNTQSEVEQIACRKEHFEEVTEVDNLVERKVPAEHMIVDVKEEPKEEFDESFWSNPHFSSIQGYLEERKSVTKICRICLQAVGNDTYQTLTTDETNFQTDIQNKVKFILPNLKLDMFSNSLVCNKCVDLVNYSIELQEKWLLSQERLNEIIDKTRREKTKVNDIIITVESPKEEKKEELIFYQVNIPTPSSINAPISSHQNVTDQNFSSSHEADTQPVLNRNQSSVVKSDKQKQNTKRNHLINMICNVCQEVFISIERYASHTQQHNETKNICFWCKKKLRNVSKLFYHMRRCLKTNNEHEIDPGLNTEKATTYKCQICKKEFLFSWYLSRHRQICTTKVLG